MLNDFASARANFYRQLAGLEDAGIPIRQALAKVRVSGGPLRNIKERLLEASNRGEDLGRAFAAEPGLQSFERQMVGAAVKVGRLSETFRELAEYFENKAAIRREIISQLGYPVIVLHVAIFLPNLYLLFTEGTAAYLWRTMPAFFILWGVLLGIPFLMNRFQGSMLLDAIFWRLPLVAGVYRANVRRTTLTILRSALAAGLIADVAFTAAADTCPGARMRAQLRRAADDARMGLPLPGIIDQLTMLPEAVRDGMASGAESGTLPEAIARLEKQLAEEARMRQKLAFTIAGVLFFLAVAAVVGYKVVSFWTGYYGNMMKG